MGIITLLDVGLGLFEFFLFKKSRFIINIRNLRPFSLRNLMEFDGIGMTNSIDQIPWSCLVHGMLTKESFKFLQSPSTTDFIIPYDNPWNSLESSLPPLVFSIYGFLISIYRSLIPNPFTVRSRFSLFLIY